MEKGSPFLLWDSPDIHVFIFSNSCSLSQNPHSKLEDGSMSIHLKALSINKRERIKKLDRHLLNVAGTLGHYNLHPNI